jgi:hypothetical protein
LRSLRAGRGGEDRESGESLTDRHHRDEIDIHVAGAGCDPMNGIGNGGRLPRQILPMLQGQMRPHMFLSARAVQAQVLFAGKKCVVRRSGEVKSQELQKVEFYKAQKDLRGAGQATKHGFLTSHTARSNSVRYCLILIQDLGYAAAIPFCNS